VLTTGSALVFDGTNFGVGTSSPASKLQAYAGTGVGASHATFGATTTGYWNFNSGGASSDRVIARGYNSTGTEIIRLDPASDSFINSGNLGVGTTSPQATIVAAGSNATVYKAMILRNGNGTDGSSATIDFETSGGTQGSEAAMAGRIAGLRIGSGTSGALTFSTTNAGVLGERARIDSSGNLLVGTTSTGYTSSGSTYYSPSVQYWINNHLTGTSSGTRYIGFGIGTGEVGSITQSGTTAVLYNTTSDYRLKNNQQALTGAKDFIMALKPKKWQWWDGSGEGVGFVAHEFMEVAKYSGNGEKDAIDADGKPVYQSIQPSSSEVMANLVAFIQEQQALISTLTDRITALEAT
jgi:hypothetical protein